MLNLNQVIAERYRVDGVLAQGWGSIVYRVTHSDTGSDYALKLLKTYLPEHDMHLSYPHLVEGLHREAQALIACASAVTPKLVYAEWQEPPLLIMSLMPGVPLEAMFRTVPNRWTFVHMVIDQLLTIVETMHQCGWIHCDLNPNNILIETSSNTVYLVDFGGSQRWADPSAWRYPVGRHRYMPPEHLLGRHDTPPYRQLSPASDLYQIAWLMIYLLTEREAFRRPLEEETYSGDYLDALGAWMQKPALEKLAVVDNFSPALTDFLALALAPEPACRFHSAAEMRTALCAL